MATITITTIDPLKADGFDFEYGSPVSVASTEIGLVELAGIVLLATDLGQGLQPNPPTVKTFS